MQGDLRRRHRFVEGERRLRDMPQARGLADAAQRHRLLQVLQVILLQIAGQRERDIGGIAHVRIDAQLEPIADAVADAADHFEILLGPPARLGLEGGEAGVKIALGYVLGFLIGPDAHARRQLDPLAHCPAQQLVERLARCLADQVPQGHFDAAGQVAAQGVLGVERFQLVWVAAQHPGAETVFRRALVGAVDPVVGRFAPADFARVRLQADEQRLFGAGRPVARLVRGDGRLLRDADPHRVQLGDLHARGPPIGSMN